MRLNPVEWKTLRDRMGDLGRGPVVQAVYAWGSVTAQPSPSRGVVHGQ